MLHSFLTFGYRAFFDLFMEKICTNDIRCFISDTSVCWQDISFAFPHKAVFVMGHIFELFPKKDWFQDPKSFVDGGGLISTPDWSRPPPSAENVFLSIRNHWIPKILDKRLHHQIVGHFQQRKVDPPFRESLVKEFRESLDGLLPLQEPLDWQVRPDQPLCLHALAAISTYMKDPDTALFPSLIEGVSTGFRDQIPPSNVFSKKQDLTEPDRPELSIHWSNWQTSESQPELTSELVQEKSTKVGSFVLLDRSQKLNRNFQLE